MSYYPSYDPGDWKCECMVCGRIFKGSKIKKRWDGLLVCQDDFEQKHDQLSVTGVRDSQWVPFTLHDNTEGTAPANYEVSQDKTSLQNYNTEIVQVTSLPTTPEAGDRVWYADVGTVLLSDGTNWYYANGMKYTLPSWVQYPIITDNFNRPDENPILPPWFQFTPFFGVQIKDNTLWGESGGGPEHKYISYSDTNIFNSNQYQKIRCNSICNEISFDSVKIYQLINLLDYSNSYLVYYYADGLNSGISSGGGVDCYKIDNNIATLLGTFGLVGYDTNKFLSNFALERNDTNIRWVIDAIGMGNVADVTFTTGNPLTIAPASTFRPGYDITAWDDFECGNVVLE